MFEFQEYAQTTAQFSQLLAVFSKQAWRALKLSGLKPTPMLHSLRPEFESFASVAFLAAATHDFPGTNCPLNGMRYHWRGCSREMTIKTPEQSLSRPNPGIENISDS